MLSAELVDATWRKSSRSNTQGNCVEVALGDQHVAIRDSKNTDGDVLLFAHRGWASFLGGTASGRMTKNTHRQ
ncbi:DUF397 domain-containing protein [Pseudonocardiaceae bacterium YIM PH 21723]|nr:DUF397 domain-containing protein [Pseudonocardiaceae bacterium YIM PH 21723]